MNVLSVGEVLWDVFPGQELLGGAPLNFSASLNRLGDRCLLMTAVGEDERGAKALEQMRGFGLATDFVQVVKAAPTGTAVVEMEGGEPRFAIPRPVAFDRLDIGGETLDRVRRLQLDWLYFGTLLQLQPEIEEGTRRLASIEPSIRCFYDINLRPGHWNLALVKRLCGLASVLKLNCEEAKILSSEVGTPPGEFSLDRFCREWAAAYNIETICVTLGADGCAIYREGELETVPGIRTCVIDTVGAGDAFAAAFLHGYHRKWPTLDIAHFANALGALVASRAGANPVWTMEELLSLTASSSSVPRNSNRTRRRIHPVSE